MSWREQLRPASFRGVSFYVDAADTSGGRRLALHEYPFRDQPFAEDLGRQGKQFQLDAYVLGDDYIAARARLEAALDAEGPGTLSHPYRGNLQVAVSGFRYRETTRDGGIARFSITFMQAGEIRYPDASGDTAQLCGGAADTLLDTAAEDFKSWWNVDGLPEGLLAELEEELTRTLDGVTRLVGPVAATIAAEIRAPANMAAALIGAVQQVGALASQPLDALRLYEGLFDAGESSPRVPTTTPARRRQAQAADALHRLTQRAAIAEASRASAAAAYASRDDALGVRDRLLAALDTQAEATDPLGRPVDDAVYASLNALRTAVATDLRTRGARLPELTTHTPASTLPAVVIAHRLYGDATRGDEIATRNNVRHPGFVPGGNPLEVLNA